MTQLEKARKGLVTDEMKICAAEEGVDAEYIRKGMVDGNIVICRNVNHTTIKPLAIGLGSQFQMRAQQHGHFEPNPQHDRCYRECTQGP